MYKADVRQITFCGVERDDFEFYRILLAVDIVVKPKEKTKREQKKRFTELDQIFIKNNKGWSKIVEKENRTRLNNGNSNQKDSIRNSKKRHAIIITLTNM
jgi:hypothetical protein